MSKQRIVDYVMNTPGNTNPNVLNSLLDEEMNDLPPIGPEDKNKYLHTNESTGALEWAEGGSGGGGVLVVHEVDGTLDKTWQEITNAIINETPAYLLKIMTDDEGVLDNARMIMMFVFTDIFKGTKYYFASAGIEGSADYLEYSAANPDDYPTLPPESSGN